MNGLKSLLYDGVDDCMFGPVVDLSSNNGGFSIFMVVQINNPLATRVLISIFDVSNQSRMQFFILGDGSLTGRSMSDLTDFKGRVSNAGAVVINTAYVLNFNDAGGLLAGNISLYVNNVRVDTGVRHPRQPYHRGRSPGISSLSSGSFPPP